jgi:type II secretory pathway pseudopilin PulG
MHAAQPAFPRSIRGYTLIETLVAGVVLMIGISAASRLTLTLLTQDEMNQRSSTALNYLETSARLYQMGLDEADIRLIVPGDPVVDSLTLTPVTGFAGVGNLEAMDVTVSFHPAAATQSWTGHIWTSGKKDAVRSSNVTAYRSRTSNTVN